MVSVENSQITNVSLYSSRAEITRAFKLDVRVGLNQVNITGLPNVLDKDSLKYGLHPFNVLFANILNRIEGTGHATIQDVTISHVPPPVKPTTSAQLEELIQNKGKTEQAIARCTLAISSLETYLRTLNVKDVGVSEVANIVRTYQTTGEELDNQLNALHDEIQKVDARIAAEQRSLSGPTDNQDLQMKVTIGVFADVEGEVDLKLVYGMYSTETTVLYLHFCVAVHSASWNALYDIRVGSPTEENDVELTYKASITQTTGEVSRFLSFIFWFLKLEYIL